MRIREKRKEFPSAGHPGVSNASWIRRHSREIVSRYAGEWIAVYHNSVIAHGHNPQLVRQNASAIVGHTRFLMKHIDKGMVIL